MDWEHQVQGFVYADEQPLTPTATPSSATAPSFGLFETPKTEPSIFDPPGMWSSTTPHNSTPQHRTPQYLVVSTPSQRPTSSSSQVKTRSGSGAIDAELASHVHHLSPNPSLSLPPVDSSRQLTSSPIPSPTNGNGGDSTIKSVYSDAKYERQRQHKQSNKPAMSMQTPPPTATSAAKRKAKQEQVVNLVKASAAGSKTMASSFKQVRSGKVNRMSFGDGQKPFHNLQFSPDVFDSHPLSGPATAPAYPQHRLFWDPNANMTTMDLGLDSNTSTIGTHPHQQGSGLDWANSPVQIQKDQAGLSSTTMFHFEANARGGLEHKQTSNFDETTFSIPPQPARSFSNAASRPHEIAAVAIPLSGAVDPNVLTSFAGDPSHTNMAPPASKVPKKSISVREGSRIPYQHQQQESRREKELERARKSRKQKVDSLQRSLNTGSLESAELLNKGPSVKRRARNTTFESSGNRFRKHTQSLPEHYNDAINDENVAPAVRRRTAMNHRSDSTLGMRSRNAGKRKRTAVTLTIDSSGRAQTEIQSIAENSESGSDADVARGLDSISDDESDSSLDSDVGHIPSRNTSFTFPQKGLTRQRKERLINGNLSQLELSSVASSNSCCTSEAITSGYKLDRRSPSTKRQPQTVRQHHLPYDEGPQSQGNQSLPLESESEAETVVDQDHQKGNAQHALRKLMKDRIRGQASDLNTLQHRYIPTAGRTASLPLSHHCTELAPNNKYLVNANGTYINVSPTTVTDPDIATPNSDQDSQMSEGTRCVCKLTENEDRMMIQCDSCAKWLHIKCVGLHHERLPPVYVCIYCTGQTPNVRGGRVREPVRPPAVSSPLAHKSYRFR
ncbi:MAG: hypothetical protein M1836_001815 [Candelina mexicana]|nr:MAG: hypothetical protein M1836_001815 [Candelina mexicana]